VPYLLGVHIGESTVKAAVCRRAAYPPSARDGAGEGWGAAQPVMLSPAGHTVAAALKVSTGGHLAPADGSNVVSGQSDEHVAGFVRRVGDDVPLRLGMRRFSAQSLMAGLVGWVVGRLWQQESAAPERIAVVHPTGWGPYRRDLLRAALDEAGFGALALVPRAGAIVAYYQAMRHLPVDDRALIAIHLGGASLEVSLLAPHSFGRHELISTTETTSINGDDLQAADTTEQHAIVRAGVAFALSTAAASGAAVGAVLLAGGAAGRPLLTDLLTAAFAAPVLSVGDLQAAAACGAALAVRPRTDLALPAREPVEAEPMADDYPLVGTAERYSWGTATTARPPRPPVHVTAATVGR